MSPTEQIDPIADTKGFRAASVYARRTRDNRRELRFLRAQETAAEAIAGLDHQTEIFGFTKGQFSLIELLAAIIDITGPIALTVSTWTAARFDAQKVMEFLNAGRVTSARWLVDLTFQRRAPAIANQIRQLFGADAIRVAQTHAKFSLFENENWRLVLRTSMNLNTNPRFEDFTLVHDPELADFLTEILDELWSRQRRDHAHAPTKEIQRAWREF